MKVALIGNPNCGKTSIFNQLTGLNQKVGNFSGVTVDRKTGICLLPNGKKAEIIDLPGTYSIYPKSHDEQVVIDLMLNQKGADYPDVVLVVVDASNIRRNLLLFTQLQDMGIPSVLILNMMDIAEKEGVMIDIPKLQEALNTSIITANARAGEGIEEIKKILTKTIKAPTPVPLSMETEHAPLIHTLQNTFGIKHTYPALLLAHNFERVPFLEESEKDQIEKLNLENNFKGLHLQSREAIERHKRIGKALNGTITRKTVKNSLSARTQKIDKFLLHPILGYVTFVSILFLLFQLLFTVADYPVGWIESLFEWIVGALKGILPEGLLTDLLTDGIISGIGGVVVFVPQIAFLFGMIAILEETGYITRVMVLMDKIMQKFGLNGQSVLPMISGIACAIPAIMSARSIENRKEKLITILVTPLMSCAARLPIFTLMIELIIPDKMLWGVFHYKALSMLGIYLLGAGMALLAAIIMKYIIKAKEKSFFVIELPTYKKPRWKNVGIIIFEKSKAFLWDAGKIITLMSIILWVLASFSPDGNREEIAAKTRKEHKELKGDDLESMVASVQLETSYAGYIGHFIEPAIRPLGYDWKIGIALITSFAAREVFVSTMSTIYSIGSEDETVVRKNMEKQIRPETGKPLYDFPLGMSLIVFYAFAMQCMGTVAVVFKETKSLKYPIIQIVYMTGLAYVMALITYQLLK